MSKMSIFAGVNGSGKTTLYNKLSENISFGQYLNADEIAKNIGDTEDLLIRIRSEKKLISNLSHLLESKKDCTIETTLSGLSLFSTIKKAKDLGYQIELYYIFTDIATSKERIKYRVSKGGHHVPDAIINRRYHKSYRNLKSYFKLFDSIYFYENSISNYKLIATYQKSIEFLSIPTEQWISDFINSLI